MGQPPQIDDRAEVETNLHHLARLTAGAAPDHAEGGVRDWVVASSLADPAGSPGPGGPAAISFDIAVAGEPAGSTTLELDGGGLPAARRQTVRFPQGTMQVVERYSLVSIVP